MELQRNIIRTVGIFIICVIPELLWTQAPPDSTAVVIFTGDLNFAEHFEYASRRGEIDVFSKWGSIGEYDLMMVNLENAVTRSVDSVKKEFVFKMRPELLSGLVRARILLVNCANNHSADFHSGGILETIKNLDRYGIKHIGIGANSDEAHAPVVLDINGVRLGFLGYADSRTFIAGRKRPGRTSMSRSRMLEDIRKLKPSVDFVIVNLHWGKELAEEPDSSQILLAHGLIDGGADLIIGHHPHVLQGIEIYGRGFIAYSLGNFVFGGNSRSVNSETAVLKAVFSKKDMKVKPLPVCIRGWKPALADSLSGLRILKKIETRSRMFRDPFSSYN